MRPNDAGKKRKRQPPLYDFQTFADGTWPIEPKGAFRDNMRLFLGAYAKLTAQEHGKKTWCTFLNHGSSPDVAVPLYILEAVQSTPPTYCNHCRHAGWDIHVVSKRNYHLIIPAPDELNNCSGDDFVDLDTHLLHGLIHCNGFGHLLQINGMEGVPTYLHGRELMDLWDRICTKLRTRKITVRDFSRQGIMDLRLLYGIGYGHSWYGKWGYKFCRGSFGVTELDYNSALQSLRSLELDQIVNDFSDMDKCRVIKQIIRHYRDKSETQLMTLNDLVRFMLTIRSHAPVRVNKATVEEVSEYSPSEISQDVLRASVNGQPGMEAAPETEPEAAGDDNELWSAAKQFMRLTQNPTPVQDEAHQLVHGGVGIPQKDGHLPIHHSTSNPLVEKGESMEDRSLKSAIAKMAANTHWPKETLTNAAVVILNALKENHGKMTRSNLRSAANLQIGDLGLLDKVLASLDGVIVGNHVVRRTKPKTTKTYEFSLHEHGNGIKASEPDTKALRVPLAALGLKPGVDVFNDLVYLYENILVDYPRLDWVKKKTWVVLNSKYFVKEWPFIDEKDEFLTFTCRLRPFHVETETEFEDGFPLGEVVVVVKPHETTVGDLRNAVETAARDTYCFARNFSAMKIVEYSGVLKDEDIIRGASFTCLNVEGIGLTLKNHPRCQAAVESWTVRCICGTTDDDGERMVACDVCNERQHTHCNGIEDSEDIPLKHNCRRCEHPIPNAECTENMGKFLGQNMSWEQFYQNLEDEQFIFLP